MKGTILHETRGRMRVHTMQGAMPLQQADILEAYLNRVSGVTKATVYDRTGDAVICYDGRGKRLQRRSRPLPMPRARSRREHSSRALNRDFEDKLVASLCWRGIKQLFVPSSVRTLITVARSVPYIKAVYVPDAQEDPGAGAGRNGDHRFDAAQGLQDGKLDHVPAGHWRHSRRVDAQEVRCRSRTDHVPECGQGLERDRTPAPYLCRWQTFRSATGS